MNLKNVCDSVPLTPSFSNPSFYNNGICIPCEDQTLTPPTNNTQINVNSNGQYINGLTVTPFYQVNTIDPIGSLFGYNQCGELNYTRYMEFNAPKITLGNS